MSWQIILLSRGFFLLLMKAQITRGIESLHIFSLLFPSTLQTLIYFSLLPFHFIVIPGSKVFFLPSALLQQLEMTGVLHSIIPICFCISMLSHFQPQIFYYLNYCFLWHFGEKKYTFWSPSQLSRSSATMVSGICCLRIHFYNSNWDEHSEFIWGEAIPFSRNSGNLLTNTWKYYWEGTEINLSGCCMRDLKAAHILYHWYMQLWYFIKDTSFKPNLSNKNSSISM